MWKIMLVIAAVLSPGTPPRILGIAMSEKTFADEAKCKVDEQSKEARDRIEKLTRDLQKKLDVPQVIVKTACVDASKKDDAAKGESI